MTYRRCFSDAGLFYVTRDDGKVIACDTADDAERTWRVADKMPENCWIGRNISYEYHEVESWDEAATLLMRKMTEAREKNARIISLIFEIRNLSHEFWDAIEADEMASKSDRIEQIWSELDVARFDHRSTK